MLLMSVGSVQAAQVQIKASYRNGKLEVDSPPAPYCNTWPELCTSAQTLRIPITYTKSFNPNGGQSDRLYFKLPPVRTGVLSGEAGEVYPFDFRLLNIGLMTRSAYARYNPATFAFYGCSVLRVRPPAAEGDWATVVLHQLSESGGPCYSDRSAFGSNYNVYGKDMGAAYQLTLASLSSMKPGRYSGILSYRVGDGADIDLGSRLTTISDTVLDVWVELTVKRDIHVDFPPGSDRAVLEPPGGWDLWSGGKPPKQLSRDVPFRVTIDGPFGVYVRCQYTVAADSCGLRNDLGHEVPVTTQLTLRSTTSGGGSAVKVTLPASEYDKRVFEPSQPLLNQPGTLHFNVGSEAVKRMVENPGSTYQGQVTVVFDASI